MTDPEEDPVSLTIDGIFQDEPVTTPDSEDLSPDGQGIGTTPADVRAERIDAGNGRVYHISFTADDGHGGTCSGAVLVGVPHDQKDTPIDDGALYNSTVGISAAAVGSADDETHDNIVFLPLVAKNE